VTNLGNDRAILGYPWLRDFNPKIDWPIGRLEGPPVEIETCFYSRFPTLRKIIAQRQNKVIPTLDHPSNDIKVRAATVAAPLNDTPVPEDMSQLPKEYIAFCPIFTKPVAGQLPPHCPWDLKVRLIPNAPLSLSCCPYQLSQPEQIFQSQYIKENLARGFIQESTSAYAMPIFYKKKKDGTYRPLFDYRKLNAITIKDVSPLPRIDTIIEDVRGMICFSGFDL
jgi:hypothetical protein